MRIILLFLVLFISKFGFSQGQPWVGNNAVWTFNFYCFDEIYGPIDGIFKIRKTGNVLRGSHLCDELLTYEHSSRASPLDSAIVDTNYTYLSVTGDSVFYEQEGLFRLLYDFSAEVGDTILYHVTTEEIPNQNCNDSSFAFISANDIVSIGGVDYRMQHRWGSDAYNSYGGFNERYGPMLYSFLFPYQHYMCWSTTGGCENLLLLCFSDDDLTHGDYCNSIGIEKNDLPSIEVMPNPFTRTIHLSGINENGAFVHLSDNLGTVLFKGTAQELEIYNAENLSAGSYRLRITLEDGHSVIKQLVKL